MLLCPLDESTHLYPSLVLALRDMRSANGRNATTGVGEGNESWIGLSLAMIVLDTLSGNDRKVSRRWKRLLTQHGIGDEDAQLIFELRCSLLHGYYIPKPERLGGRTLLLTDDRTAYALDTSQDGRALLSVPVFCGRLVERIAAEAPEEWDISLINTNYPM